MTFIDDYSWGKIGKIPPESDFFKANLDIDDVMDGQGFTMQYSKLVGEQVFKVTEPSETPFTARLTGAPIRAGAGWVERMVKRMGAGTTTSGNAKAGVIQRKNSKLVTADDDLRYYDSEGKEFVYSSESLRGWIPVTLPSGLDIYDMFTQEDGMAQLNSMLVDNVKQGYDLALESELQKYAVNMCPTYKSVSTTGRKVFTEIRNTVSKMRSDDYAFNMFAIEDSTLATEDPTFNDNYEHKSKDVIIFMNRLKYDAMMDSFADVFSPNKIKDIGAEIVPMDNAMPTPYATAQAMATDGFTAYGGIVPATDLPMLGKSAPDVLIMDKRFVEYRPVIDSYRVNISKNSAGDFTNEHLHFVGGINAKPWANAVAMNVTITDA